MGISWTHTQHEEPANNDQEHFVYGCSRYYDVWKCLSIVVSIYKQGRQQEEMKQPRTAEA